MRGSAALRAFADAAVHLAKNVPHASGVEHRADVRTGRSEPVKPAPTPPRRKTRRPRRGGIELEIDGVVVRVGSDASAKTVAAVIGALKAQR